MSRRCPSDCQFLCCNRVVRNTKTYCNLGTCPGTRETEQIPGCGFKHDEYVMYDTWKIGDVFPTDDNRFYYIPMDGRIKVWPLNETIQLDELTLYDIVFL